jgi:hypothetical protein
MTKEEKEDDGEDEEEKEGDENEEEGEGKLSDTRRQDPRFILAIIIVVISCG